MSDTLFLKLFIGDKQYELERALDSDLLSVSHGKQSITSALLGVLMQMSFEIADEVVRDGKRYV
jgi:hypothetical protein